MSAAAILLMLLGGASVRVAVADRVAVAQTSTVSAPFFAGIGEPASFKAAMDARLAHATEARARLLAVTGRRTVENTLQPYDDLNGDVNDIIGETILITAVHPDQRMRQIADEALQRATALNSERLVNRAAYDALKAIDARSADAEAKYYVDRELRAFRRAGVDKDDATRARLTQLQIDLGAISQQFLRNIRANKRTVVVKSVADLDGLPADFIARHKPDASGAMTVGTDGGDVQPVLTFAKSEDLRRRLYIEWTNIGYPENIELLNTIVATCAEIAHLLGYENWAAYDMLGGMSGSAKASSDFIDRVVAASGAKAARDYSEILKRKQQDVPGATGVNAWENTYYAELVRKASYDFDSQSMRVYFPFDRVRQGVFDVTTRLYGVTYRPAKDAPVWHPSVEAYEMLRDGAVIGRFYLDLHPRPDKASNSAITMTVRSGARRELPELVLVASLPGGQPGDPGLMSHDDVRTFFHEFGHLVHFVLSGGHRWFGLTRVAERDFIEAPSQMFEEWTWDPATLATFARHYQTNAPVPAALVVQMQRASKFGRGLSTRQQMIFAKLALSLHDRDPRTVDSTALLREITNAYVPFPYVEGSHRQTQLTFLANDNYTASYYIYMWSLVIAQDLFSEFDSKNLLAPGIAHRYRDTVLAPGGSKSAAALVSDFLGRPFNAKAWETWLNRDPS
jgi:thimet oligopeptidase